MSTTQKNMPENYRSKEMFNVFAIRSNICAQNNTNIHWWNYWFLEISRKTSNSWSVFWKSRITSANGKKFYKILFTFRKTVVHFCSNFELSRSDNSWDIRIWKVVFLAYPVEFSFYDILRHTLAIRLLLTTDNILSNGVVNICVRGSFSVFDMIGLKFYWIKL